jgi:hypothetical protein
MGQTRHGWNRLPLVPVDDVSHADIYRSLGILEGKLDAVVQALTQRNQEFETALKRIGDLEKTVAKGLGMAMTFSVVLPIVISGLGVLLTLSSRVGGQAASPPAAHPVQQHNYRP